MMKVLLYFCLLLLLFSCSPKETLLLQASKIQFQTLDDMSAADHFSSSTPVCSRASTNGSKNGASSSRLEVVHRYGPCGSGGEDSKQQALTLAEILFKDQLRVQSIHKSLHNHDHHLNYTNNPEAAARGDNQIHIPVESGDSLDSGNYVVTIGLGTPEHYLTLIFDTGSDVTWTQCLPCYPRECYPQKEPLFRPSASSTYSRIPCSSTYCRELNLNKRGGKGCVHKYHDCTYKLYYTDGSYTTGFYSNDKLTFSPGEVFPNFRFGCGNHNSVGFGRVSGILGLGRGPTSFVSQTKQKYSGVFSYCLPPDISSTGFLSFGGEHYNTRGMVFTPLVPDPSLSKYHITITAISVGGFRLRIRDSVFTNAGAIIDSGTVLTRLPPDAYNEMKKEFTRQMTMILRYKSAPAYDDLLDTCFNITKNEIVPTISFTFEGDARVDFARSGILYYVDSRLACLAFTGNRNSWDKAVLGNTQQLRYEVMYDLHRNQLGFRRNSRCL